MKKQILFLRYDERSGSTLLSALLNRYEGISVSHESSFVSRIIDYPEPISPSTDVNRICSYLFAVDQFSNLLLSESDVYTAINHSTTRLSKKTVIDSVLRLYFEKRDPQADVWIVKSPLWYHFDQVRALFPDVRLLHVVRDGRAIYSSKRQTSVKGRPAMQSNLLHAAYTWRRKLNIAYRHRESTYEIRYEDLVSDPEKSLQGILDYLELPEEKRVMSKSQQEYFEDIDELHKTIHLNVPREPMANNAEKWRSALDATDVRLFEFVNRDYLRRYGYACSDGGFSGPSFVKLVGRGAYYLSKYASDRLHSAFST